MKWVNTKKISADGIFEKIDSVRALTLTVRCISESCVEIKIKLNFHFHTSLWIYILFLWIHILRVNTSPMQFQKEVSTKQIKEWYQQMFKLTYISFYHLPGIYNNNLKVFVFKFFNTIGSNDSRIWFRVAERTAETLKL